jgi:ribosomal protein S18 acetylase RimI-like enzyme
MEFTQKTPQVPGDFPGMIELANRFKQSTFHVTDLPYRFSSWALDDPTNASLWFNADNDLIGWAVMQTPWWTVDLSINPQFTNRLLPQVLSWIDQHAQSIRGTEYGHPSWYIPVFSEQSGTIRALEKTGYVCQSFLAEGAWTKVCMERTTTPLPKKYPPPPGFSIRPLRGLEEVESYVSLHQETFKTKNMTIPWRIRTIQLPAYRSNFDLVVTSPEGRLCAFCIAWVNDFDPLHRSAQIEPLGCHPDFSRYALGRVVLAAMLERLVESGIQQIEVETDGYRDTAFRLYQSLGFEVKRDVLMFGKEF